jgi:hypothetical protein
VVETRLLRAQCPSGLLSSLGHERAREDIRIGELLHEAFHLAGDFLVAQLSGADAFGRNRDSLSNRSNPPLAQ